MGVFPRNLAGGEGTGAGGLKASFFGTAGCVPVAKHPSWSPGNPWGPREMLLLLCFGKGEGKKEGLGYKSQVLTLIPILSSSQLAEGNSSAKLLAGLWLFWGQKFPIWVQSSSSSSPSPASNGNFKPQLLHHSLENPLAIVTPHGDN